MIIFLLPNEVKEKILLSISVKRTHTNVSDSKFALSGRDSNARHYPSIPLLYRLTHVMLYMCNTCYKHDKSWTKINVDWRAVNCSFYACWLELCIFPEDYCARIMYGVHSCSLYMLSHLFSACTDCLANIPMKSSMISTKIGLSSWEWLWAGIKLDSSVLSNSYGQCHNPLLCSSVNTEG